MRKNTQLTQTDVGKKPNLGKMSMNNLYFQTYQLAKMILEKP